MEVEPTGLPASAPEPPLAPEGGLVIATPTHSRRAAELCAAMPGRILIGILQCDAPEPEAAVSTRCDFIVRRPVHAAALRLLFHCALYAGPERRSRERVAVGAAVTLRAGLRTWVATLLELSPRSCRLLSPRAVELDRKVGVRLPRRLTGGEVLGLRGRVVRSEAADRDRSGVFEIVVSFDSVAPAQRRALRVILEGHLIGPASLATDGMGADLPLPLRTRPGPGRVGGARRIDRRSEPRQTESGLPPTARVNPGTLAAVLIGRDLSPAGMRLERDSALALGDELDLLLHGGARQASIAVKAAVARIDAGGCFLRFADVGAAEAARIEELVDALVVTERPRTAAAAANRVVISEVLRSTAG